MQDSITRPFPGAETRHAAGAATAAAPFRLTQPVGTVLHMRRLAAPGLNFRHLLHLGHEAAHRAMAPDATPQNVSVRLAATALTVGRILLRLCRTVPCGAELQRLNDGARFELVDASGPLPADGHFSAA